MSKKMYVGNLPFSETKGSLKGAFAQFGTEESVNIITDRYTGQSKGFGFIERAKKSEADATINKMNGSELDRLTLKVSEVRPQAPRDRSGQGHGFTGGGNHGW